MDKIAGENEIKYRLTILLINDLLAKKNELSGIAHI